MEMRFFGYSVGYGSVSENMGSLSVNVSTLIVLETRVGKSKKTYQLAEILTGGNVGNYGACAFGTDWFDLKLESTNKKVKTLPNLANQRVEFELKGGHGPNGRLYLSILDDNINVIAKGKKFVQLFGMLFGGFKIVSRLTLVDSSYIIQSRPDWRNSHPSLKRFLKK